MILNRQRNYAVSLPALRVYVRNLRRALRLGRREFNICLIGDREMGRLNAAFRSTPRATDVLSFPWEGDPQGNGANLRRGELRRFLGDVAISVETARRNARVEGHSTINEIRWLVLHGLLHLLGYDHENDRGEMTRTELALRERLGIAEARRSRRVRKGAKGTNG